MHQWLGHMNYEIAANEEQKGEILVCHLRLDISLDIWAITLPTKASKKWDFFAEHWETFSFWYLGCAFSFSCWVNGLYIFNSRASKRWFWLLEMVCLNGRFEESKWKEGKNLSILRYANFKWISWIQETKKQCQYIYAKEGEILEFSLVFIWWSPVSSVWKNELVESVFFLDKIWGQIKLLEFKILSHAWLFLQEDFHVPHKQVYWVVFERQGKNEVGCIQRPLKRSVFWLLGLKLWM